MKAASFDKIDVPPLLNLDRSFRRQKLELSKIGHVTTFCGIKCLNEPATTAHVQSFSPNVFDYALRNKGYLARNAFQPLVVYPVLVAAAVPRRRGKFLDSIGHKHVDGDVRICPWLVDVHRERMDLSSVRKTNSGAGW